jgi:N-methylhydantoinase A
MSCWAGSTRTSPIGGKLDRLDVEAARAPSTTHVGAAWPRRDGGRRGHPARRQFRMAGAIRLVSIERGFDPKRFAFMPFGGGGALHARAPCCRGRHRPRHRAALSRRDLGAGLRDRRHAAGFRADPQRACSTGWTSTRCARCRRHVDEGMALLDAPGRLRGPRHGLRAGHGLCRPDPHGAVPLPSASRAGTVTRAHIGGSDAPSTRPILAAYGRLLENGGAAGDEPAHRGDRRRPKFDLGHLAPDDRRQRRRGAHGTGGAFRRRLARDGDLRPAGVPVGAEIAGPRSSCTARHHRPDRARPAGRVDRFGNTIIERKDDAMTDRSTRRARRC